MSDYFFVKAGNKEFHFVRTCTGKFYDITNCSIITDGHIDENDGLIPDAIPVSEEYVAELVSKSRPKGKGKASKILGLTRRMKEAV